MAYLKHPEHGNKEAPDSDVERLQAEGWVKWPRTKEQKAGIAPAPAPAVPVEPAGPAAAAPEIKPKRKYTRKG